MFGKTALSLAALLHSAYAGLYIVSPQELKDTTERSEMRAKLSNVGYGNFQKGTSRIGQVITPLSKDGQGCEPLNWETDFTEKEMAHFAKTEGFFLLLQRGGCSFSTKVKHAQQFGAEVLLISDFKDAEQALLEQNEFDGKLDGNLMTHIPAFEIDWVDAKKMVEYIWEGEQVVYLQATFDVTNQDNTVEVDLYYSTSLDLGTNLSTELAALSLSFTPDHMNKPLFTPRIATFSCLNCEDDFRRANCMSNGAYCGYTPNFYKEYDLDDKGVSMTGKEILMQALREKCLHKLMSTKYKDEGDLFWTFFGYLSKCFNSENLLGAPPVSKSFDECFDWSTVMIGGHEEIEYLNNCVEDSFAVKGDHQTDNMLLRDDRIWANANHIKMHPAITINNSTYTDATGEQLALAICSAYREAPDECELAWQIASFSNETYEGLDTPHGEDDLYEMSKVSVQPSEGEVIFGSWHLYVIIGVILAVNAAVMIYVRWRMKRQMRDEMNSSVNQAVTQYFALSGTE